MKIYTIFFIPTLIILSACSNYDKGDKGDNEDEINVIIFENGTTCYTIIRFDSTAISCIK